MKKERELVGTLRGVEAGAGLAAGPMRDKGTNDLVAKRRDLVRGCFLGGALGDALGDPVEFLSLPEIRDRFGPDGIRGFEPADSRRGEITDDTQMTLFTAEGLIRAHNDYLRKGICHSIQHVFKAYLRWLHTQGMLFREMCGFFTRGEPSSWLLQQKVLHQRRAPGHTCLSALRAQAEERHAWAKNDSKGCGGVMWVAPVGLVMRQPFQFGVQSAHLTHGHETGYVAAGAFALVVDRLLPHARSGRLRGVRAAHPAHPRRVGWRMGHRRGTARSRREG